MLKKKSIIRGLSILIIFLLVLSNTRLFSAFAFSAEPNTEGSNDYLSQALRMTDTKKITWKGKTHNGIVMNMLEDTKTHHKYIGYCLEAGKSWKSAEYDTNPDGSPKPSSYTYYKRKGYFNNLNDLNVSDNNVKQNIYINKAVNYSVNNVYYNEGNVYSFEGTTTGAGKGYPVNAAESVKYVITQLYIWGCVDDSDWFTKSCEVKAMEISSALISSEVLFLNELSVRWEVNVTNKYVPVSDIVNICKKVVYDIEHTDNKYKAEWMIPQNNINDQKAVFIISGTPNKISIKLLKKSMNEKVTGNNIHYSLEGAVYELFKKSDDKYSVAKFVTASDGFSDVLDIEPGRYYLEETFAPTGYKKSNLRIPVDLYGDTTLSYASYPVLNEDYKRCSLMFKKLSSEKDITKLGSYSFEGAKYSLYYTKNKPLKADFIYDGNVRKIIISNDEEYWKVADIELDRGGNAHFTKLYNFLDINPSSVIKNGMEIAEELPLGYYSAIETEAPKSYKISDTVYSININDDLGINELVVYDNAIYDPLGITVIKENEYKNLYGPSLEGTIFEFKYYDGFYNSSNLPETSEKTWYVNTLKNDKGYSCRLDNSHLIKDESDELYINDEGMPYIPLGTITIKEYKSAKDYEINSGKFIDCEGTIYENTFFIAHIKASGDNSKLYAPESSDSITFTKELKDRTLVRSNLRKRVDFSFRKINSSGVPLGNVSFELSYLDNSDNIIESHIITTDNEGYYDSSDDDLWIYGLNEGKTYNQYSSEKKGSLLPGRYMLTEIKNEANAGYQLMEPIIFEVNDYENIEIGNLINYPNPYISTTEYDNITGNHITFAGDNASVTDSVYYYNLSKGKTYTIKGVIMELCDNSSVKPFYDNDKPVCSYKTFEAEDLSGKTELIFYFDASNLKGKKLVIYEYLYEGENTDEIRIENDKILLGNVFRDSDGNLVCHENKNDINQIIIVPQVNTYAFGLDGIKEFEAGKLYIYDNIEYKNLIAGNKYKIKGYIIDLKNKTYVKIDNKTAFSEFVFTADETGKTVVSYSVDMSDYIQPGESRDFVICEYLYDENDVLIAAHDDLYDSNQKFSIYKPDIPPEPDIPKTGDNTNLSFFVILLLISLQIIILYVKIKHKYQ